VLRRASNGEPVGEGDLADTQGQPASNLESSAQAELQTKIISLPPLLYLPDAYFASASRLLIVDR